MAGVASGTVAFQDDGLRWRAEHALSDRRNQFAHSINVSITKGDNTRKLSIVARAHVHPGHATGDNQCDYDPQGNGPSCSPHSTAPKTEEVTPLQKTLVEKSMLQPRHETQSDRERHKKPELKGDPYCATEFIRTDYSRLC